MKPALFPLKNYPTPNNYYISQDKLDEPWYAMHFHDSIEITLLIKGTCNQLINGTEYFMPTYTYTIMWRQDYHRFHDFSPDNLLYNLMISPSLLPESILKKLEATPSDKICTLPEDVGKTVISILDTLAQAQAFNHNYMPRLASSLCENLIDIFFYHYKTHPTSKIVSHESIIQNALIYINAHYNEALSLQDIAKYANCNAAHLSESFHKKMNMTIKQYITILRIKKAKKLLVTTNSPISSIAYESGFSSLASFNRNFLEQENLSPTAYRKKLATKNTL
ncbi:MAG: helix-turn-helix transcriptional regulator [Clostridia bacterium]|nr:helix-turn-helix transcriptional regulator [Clostridia bacterium]